MVNDVGGVWLEFVGVRGFCEDVIFSVIDGVGVFVGGFFRGFRWYSGGIMG